MPKGRSPKINLGTPTVFEIYKFQKPLWTCLGMSAHAHLKLDGQFVALIDMKLHAQNQLFTSISFWDIKVLKACLGPCLAHNHLHLHDHFKTLIDMKLHAQNLPYTSFSFWDLKVLIASLGMPGHAWTHWCKIISSICSFYRYVPACKKSSF